MVTIIEIAMIIVTRLRRMRIIMRKNELLD
jgi:hypothetical protein